MGVRTVGVEEEFLLVDATGVPAPLGDRVVGSAARWSASDEGFQHELQLEQAETGTRPCDKLADLQADLDERRRDLAQAAVHQGVRIAALGASPLPVTPTVTPDERYRRMMTEYGVVAHEQLTCGCHVHVAIDSRDEGVAVVNAIQPWLSVLLAISANSPFYQGSDTGYASYRRMVWDRWPSSGPTAPFAGIEEYEAAVATLVDSGVLLDEGMVYFDARLSARYPTVEVRVADVCATTQDAVLVAGLSRALVDAAAGAAGDAHRWPVARTEMLRGAAWRAARSGMTGDLVDPVRGTAVPAADRAQQLVDLVEPSLRRHGDLELVQDGLERVLAQGNGAVMQRAGHARRGQLGDVVADAVQRTART
jgi:carboxylate-amine ligase